MKRRQAAHKVSIKTVHGAILSQSRRLQLKHCCEMPVFRRFVAAVRRRRLVCGRLVTADTQSGQGPDKGFDRTVGFPSLRPIIFRIGTRVPEARGWGPKEVAVREIVQGIVAVPAAAF